MLCRRRIYEKLALSISTGCLNYQSNNPRSLQRSMQKTKGEIFEGKNQELKIKSHCMCSVSLTVYKYIYLLVFNEHYGTKRPLKRFVDENRSNLLKLTVSREDNNVQ